MTFWQFIDKQLDRLNPTAIAGAGIFVLTGIILWMLQHDHTLATNDLFKTLSQAIVVQGLVGLAMAAWFTKRPESGPQDVNVTNKPSDPVPTHDTDASDGEEGTTP